MTNEDTRSPYYHEPRERMHRASLRLPARLIHVLDILAEKGGRSRNRQIERIVTRYLVDLFPCVPPKDWPTAAAERGEE